MIEKKLFEHFDMDNYFTLKQLCEEFGVSEPTIWRWRKQGLKTTKIGGKPIFHKSNVMEYFNRQNS